MKEQVDTLKQHPSRDFNLSEIVSLGLFPWARDIRTVRKIIKRDFLGANILKAEIAEAGRRTVYAVKAKNIIRFLEVYGPGYMATVRTRGTVKIK